MKKLIDLNHTVEYGLITFRTVMLSLSKHAENRTFYHLSTSLE
jgi:hypothetical protein